MGGASLLGGLYRNHRGRQSRASQLSQLSQYLQSGKNEDKKFEDDVKNGDGFKNSKIASSTSWLRSISILSSKKETRENSVAETIEERESSLRKLSNLFRKRWKFSTICTMTTLLSMINPLVINILFISGMFDTS